MRPNALIARWQDGKSATNCWLTLGNPLVAEMMAHQGWDSVTVDMQHGQADFSAMREMLTAISTTKAVPLVRVPWNEPGTIMHALDAGAYGVICPNVDTREQCEQFIGACRYPPQGYRSVGPNSMRAVLYAGSDYISHANATLLTIVQIESAKGLENIAGIAGVPGLDMLFVGSSDIALSLGREANIDSSDPMMVEAIDTILAAAKKAKLRAGTFCRSVDYARAMVAQGFDLVTITSDEALITSGGSLSAQFADRS